MRSIISNVARRIVTPPTAVVNGGVLSSDATHYYRTFTANGTFAVTVLPLNIESITVAGGGASLNLFAGGGGGAGGLQFQSVSDFIGSRGVFIGAGAPAADGNTGAAANGSQSSIAAALFTPANGGGASKNPSTAGGSGAGGQACFTFNGPPENGTANTSGQGFPGGNGARSTGFDYAGGGGGGSGAAGQNATTPIANPEVKGGNGGNGTTAYSAWGIATGTGQLSGGIRYFAGGGGGSTNGDGRGTGFGAGGLGGGGSGDNWFTSRLGTAGLVNTGGGAGAGSIEVTPGVYNGLPAGSGIVIIRYLRSAVGG